MWNAVNTTPISVQSYLDENVLGKNLRVISSIVRKFPMLAYFGFSIPNHYKDSILSDSLTYEEAQSINFKDIGGWIKPMMSKDGKSVEWYEVGAFGYSQAVDTTVSVAATSVVMESVKGFEVGDVVLFIPAVGSVNWVRATREITAINTLTLTLDSAITVDAGDTVKYLYSTHTAGAKITRGTSEDDGLRVTTYFQKYGWNFEYTQDELNTTYLFADTSRRVKNKLSETINLAINNFAYTFYYGRNVSGAKAETQGLETLLAEKVANGETTVVRDWSTGLANDAAKVAAVMDFITSANTAPVYQGSEQPTFIANELMISALSQLLQSWVVYQQFVEKEIDWGIKVFSSPFFKNVSMLVDQSLNLLYPDTSVIYALPKHLVSFTTKMYDTPDVAGVVKTYNSNGFAVIPQPVVTNDVKEFTIEMWMANIFAGQTFTNSYMKASGL